MNLLIGTSQGVFAASDNSLDHVKHVLSLDQMSSDNRDPPDFPVGAWTGGRVFDLAVVNGIWFAATEDGLYRSENVEEWTQVISHSIVTSVAGSPNGQLVYSGTLPPSLYRSSDGGETWKKVEEFETIESRDKWWNPDVKQHTKTIATHPEVPDRLIIGVDGGGVHVSDDGGDTWSERRGGIPQFIHNIFVLGPETYVATTDAGLFRTCDGGHWWTYLYNDIMEHRYFRGVFGTSSAVYSGGARSHPGVWYGEKGADAALYKVAFSRGEFDIQQVPYDGEAEEVVIDGTGYQGELIAGTNKGRLLRRRENRDIWKTTKELGSDIEIRCLQAI